MREIYEQEQKEICLNILKYIKKICKDNDISYSLTGGTLLGAVRHHGFIPWDDDIDIFMPRPDYERFSLVMQNQDEYIWLTEKYDKNYFLNYGRVVDKHTRIIDDTINNIDGYGIFVDVCVVDGLPDRYFMRMLHIAHMRVLYRLRRSATYSLDTAIPSNSIKRELKKILQKYTRKVGVQTWRKRLENCAKKYPFDSGKYVGNLMSQYGKKEVMHHKSFEGYIDMQFEDESFKVCAGWEEYLSQIYGDYMQLPPVEQRFGHHTGTAYWLENEETGV